MRSAGSVLDEIEFLVKKCGVKEIQFIDDNLTCNRQRAIEIFEGIINRGLNIQWNTPNGIAVWTIDEELLELMKKSGCYELTVAFESGDQDVVSKIIKKPINLKRAAQLVGKMKELNIQVHSFFISGFPGETIEQMKRTFEFANEMDLDSAWFFMANPTPGSELHDICVENGYLDKDFSYENIEYNFAHIKTKDFTPEQVEKLVLVQFNKYLFSQLLRHPVKFLKKYLKVIIAHPIMSLRSIFSDIVRIVAR